MTKISSASIRLVLKKNRSNSVGENPIYVVVCFNGRKELEEPLINIDLISLYSARHSFANSYLSQPKASIHGLASLMARSPNSIATYVHQLQGDKNIVDATKDLPI